MTAPNYTTRWTFLAALVFSSETSASKGQFCAGSLIATKTILTAAHCVTTFSFADGVGVTPDGDRPTMSVVAPADIDVVIGRRVLSASDGERINVTGIAVNKEYDPLNITNDVALLTLETAPVGITPVPIVGAAETALWGNGAGLVTNPVTGPWIAGWGNKNPDFDLGISPPVYPNTMREAVVPIIDDTLCKEGGPGNGIGLERYFDETTQICAGILDTHNLNDLNAVNNGVGDCYGDSGGPLMVTDGVGGWRIAGIVSWGLQCASRTSYSVFTRVNSMRTWIESDPVEPVRNTKAPRITGRKVVGKKLLCHRGGWTGAAPITYTYEWYRVSAMDEDSGFYMSDDEESSHRPQGRRSTRDLSFGFMFGSSYDKITGARSIRYKLKKADKGKQIACRVIAANASWTEYATSANVGPILGRGEVAESGALPTPPSAG